MFNESTSPVDEDLFELLANSRRRRLLHHLFDRGGKAPLRELSRAIAADEVNATPEEVDSDETTNVYISLYQTHIPALEEEQIVEYDDAERIVTLGQRSDDIDTILHDTERHRRWGVYYLLVAFALGLVVVVNGLRAVSMPGPVVPVSTIGSTAVMLAIAIGHYHTASDR